MIPFWFGTHLQVPPGDVVCVQVDAPDGHIVTLTHLWLNSGYDLLFLDGKIGETLLPMDGPIHVNFFSDDRTDFAVGSLTPECPMRLYFRTIESTTIYPYLNVVVKGTMEEWVPDRLGSTIERSKAVQEIQLADYFDWLSAQNVPNLLDFRAPVEAYLRGRLLSDKEKTPGYSAFQTFIDRATDAAKGTPFESLFTDRDP